MDNENGQPRKISPGSNMPVDPKELNVVPPPTDPLETYVAPSQSPGGQTNQNHPVTPKNDRIEHYSHSDLIKKKQIVRRWLYGCIVLLILLAIAMPAYFYGPSLYRRFTVNPNEVFERMLFEIMAVETEFHNIESSSQFGLFQATYDRDSSDFFNPRSSGKAELDIVTSNLSIDTQVDIVGTRQGYNVQNLSQMKILRDGISINTDKLSLVANKWVNVPTGTDFSNEGLTISFFEIASSFNQPNRFLPIGYLDDTLRDLAHKKIQDLEPYRYDCQLLSEEEVVACEVNVSAEKLNDFYEYLADAIDLEYMGDNTWPENFTVFIDSSTNLPTEIRIEGQNTAYTKQVMAFGVNIDEIREPIGAISLDEYRLLAQEFETSL